jgi:hypothetical protein
MKVDNLRPIIRFHFGLLQGREISSGLTRCRITHSSAAVLPLQSKGKMVSWSVLLGEHVLSKLWVRDGSMRIHRSSPVASPRAQLQGSARLPDQDGPSHTAAVARTP